MKSPLTRSLVTALVVAATACFAGEKPDGSAIEVGAADAKEVGKLPNLTTELSRRGAAAVAKRDWKSARAAYVEMVEAEPDNPLALANLGSVEFQLKDFDSAVTHLDGALRQKPHLAQTWLTLGMVYYEREEFFFALSAVSRAVAEKPGDPRAHNYLAAVLKALGWANAAESELQKVLDLDQNSAEAHFNLALMYLDRKPPASEMARRHYQRALELGTPKDELVEKQLQEAADGPSDEPAVGAAASDPAAKKPAGSDKSPTVIKPATPDKSKPKDETKPRKAK